MKESQNTGITPACAGRTIASKTIRGNAWDHPRVCGKDCGGLNEFLFELGITPACAGRTAYPANVFSASWDHPRVCGKDDRHTFDAIDR